MRQRIEDLGLKQFEISVNSGISIATIREMIKGVPRVRDPRTLRAVSESLQWPADRLETLLSGVPVPDDGRPPQQDREQPGGLEEVRTELREVVERVDSLPTDVARAGELQAVKNRLGLIEANLVDLYGRLGFAYPHGADRDTQVAQQGLRKTS